MPSTHSCRGQLTQTIRELEIGNLMESESNSDLEDEILLLNDLYTKYYVAPQALKNHTLLKVAVGLSFLGFNGNGTAVGNIQIIFGVIESTVVLYTKWVIQAIHNSNGHTVKWPSKEERKESSQVMQMELFPNCVGELIMNNVGSRDTVVKEYEKTETEEEQKDLKLANVVVPALQVSTYTTEEKVTFNTKVAKSHVQIEHCIRILKGW
ncbi:hypothetical protein PPACK8108_LOCUS25049 [Phakopsora pachyrhizi]|uniref:DDE Tnp4 domain-containing protein n=1 Tax=Phakopsora pachyrhizi TaxID=170000 RepID=A0AAV0BTW0_PHAPC|nr:hypothetical protein PPACK8108_LOCUS25049 [Phakopsora pachyrhizi]